MPCGNSELGHQWFGGKQLPKPMLTFHQLNQYERNVNQTTTIFFQENAIENVVHRMTTNLFRFQCVKNIAVTWLDFYCEFFPSTGEPICLLSSITTCILQISTPLFLSNMIFFMKNKLFLFHCNPGRDLIMTCFTDAETAEFIFF